jgi:outer membrane immunogenic protein
MSGYALAADAVVEDVVVEPIFIWTGGYVGLHAGYAWGRENDNLSEFEPPASELVADEFDVDGFLGGIHAGYNWQSGSFVYGVEGDLDYADIEGGADFDFGGDPGHLSLESDWQASLRLRAGYAVDTWLLYATGGVAFGHAELEGTAPGISESDDNTHVGWTLGAGVEKAFTPNWIGRLEVRYSDFGSEEYDLGVFGDSVEADWHQTAVTVGVSYKF